MSDRWTDVELYAEGFRGATSEFSRHAELESNGDPSRWSSSSRYAGTSTPTTSLRASRALVGRRAPRDYQAEHGDFLGDADFLWCPEGLRESDARLLGDVAGARVLEVGAGAAQCSRWLDGARARVRSALDVSAAQLAHAPGARRAHRRRARTLVQADAQRLPFARRVVRPGLLGVRRGAVRRGLRSGDARGGAGAAARAGAGCSR